MLPGNSVAGAAEMYSEIPGLSLSQAAHFSNPVHKNADGFLCCLWTVIQTTAGNCILIHT